MQTIVTTKKHRASNSCVIGDIQVSFNADLEAEVNDKDVEMLLKRDSSLAIKGSEKDLANQKEENEKELKANATQPKNEDQTQATIKVFENMVQEVKDAIEEKDAEKARELFDKVVQFENVHEKILDARFLNGVEEQIFKLENVVEAAKDDVDTAEAKETLMAEKMDDLKAMAEAAELPEEEWKGFKKKEDLVDYILSKQESEKEQTEE